MSLFVSLLVSLSFAVTFDVDIDPSLGSGHEGSLLFVLSEQGPVRLDTSTWMNPPQVFRAEVSMGRAAHYDEAGLVGFPKQASEVQIGTFWVRAIARRNADSPFAGEGAGDWVSPWKKVTLDGTPVDLVINEEVQRPVPEGTDRVHFFNLHSELLSEFHGRPVWVPVTVVLPRNYQEGETYPVIYHVSGFGGNVHERTMAHNIERRIPKAGETLQIAVSAGTLWGHSVFADSATNGPWGQFMVEEVVPKLEAQYGGNGRRYVTGISSGGWSSLWLAVTYPETFDGCYSHVPDPVTFEDFQGVNLYEEGANLFFDPTGARRPIARSGGRVLLWYQDFVRREEVTNPGGQIASFEGVFSPRGADGTPLQFFDRVTGDIISETVEAWRKYDILHILEQGWAERGDEWAGKLHVYAGAEDNFYLEGAVEIMAERLGAMGADAEVMVIPGLSHAPHWPGYQKMFDAATNPQN